MSNIISVTSMTSREIAELTGKEHFHVARDLKVMFAELEIDASNFGCIYLDSQNRQQTEYRLDKELTITLTTGYSAKQRNAIVKRWLELESNAMPHDFPSALRAYADQVELTAAKQVQIEAMTPMAELGAAVACEASTLRDWISQLKQENNRVKERATHKLLEDRGYLFREKENNHLRAYADYDDLFLLKPTQISLPNGRNKTVTSLRITRLGMQQLYHLVMEHFRK